MADEEPDRFDAFDKVNFVVDAWSEPCEAPWYIYVQLAKPVALTAFLALLEFGWGDVARGYFRPKGLGRRTGKRKGKRNHRLPAFPEIGNTLGKQLPGADQASGLKWGACGRFLWRIDTALQAGLFGWLIADITSEAAYNFSSLLYETRWCAASAKGRFSYRTIGMGAIPNNTWKVAGFGTEDYENSPPIWFFNSGFSGPKGCTVAAALNVEQRLPFAPPTSFKVVVWNLNTDEAFTDYDPCGLSIEGNGAGCTKAVVPPNTSFEVRAWMEGAQFANYGDGVVTAVELD